MRSRGSPPPAPENEKPREVRLPTAPADLAAHLPAGAAWVHSPALDRGLARGDAATLHFDAASDTVYVLATNLSPQDEGTAVPAPPAAG
ncbi:hypothetical protein ACWGB8_21815 [Kitasatospora sp. NPDC054939]